MALHVMDEAARCLGCKKPRCREGCPIGTNIPEVIRLLKEGKLDEAGWMLFENNPLTTVCSLVCNHESQCEGHCIQGIKEAPVRRHRRRPRRPDHRHHPGPVRVPGDHLRR